MPNPSRLKSTTSTRKVDPRSVGLLWGRAAGRCSRCDLTLAPILENSGVIVLGEMCHIIARSKGGPRGSELVPTAMRNRYENLILLCPNDHGMIDKAPLDFTVAKILEWKAAHETRIERALSARRFDSRKELFRAVLGYLAESEAAWRNVGPESLTARANPLTAAADEWGVRKLTVIIPNNRAVISMLTANRLLLRPPDHDPVALFNEHALAFEQSAISRLDREAQPRFPPAFRVLVKEGAEIGNA